ncbi:MAG: hypothetical protein VXZ58_01925, partial [Actinomycetota bacterium]|nr:hypothetical protein [Actinomycetota bacterium]
MENSFSNSEDQAHISGKGPSDQLSPGGEPIVVGAGVDTNMNVKVKIQTNPRLHTPSLNVFDIVSAAKDTIKGKDSADSGALGDSVSSEKVNSALSYVVAANAMRNRMVAELSIYEAWDTVNTRMVIRCLDLVLQTCYTLLTQDDKKHTVPSKDATNSANKKGEVFREIDAAFRDINLPSFRGGKAAATKVSVPGPTGTEDSSVANLEVIVEPDDGGDNDVTGLRSQSLSVKDRRMIAQSLYGATLSREELAVNIYALVGAALQKENSGGANQKGIPGLDKHEKDNNQDKGKKAVDSNAGVNILELWTPNSLLSLWLEAIQSAQTNFNDIYKQHLSEITAALKVHHHSNNENELTFGDN